MARSATQKKAKMSAFFVDTPMPPWKQPTMALSITTQARGLICVALTSPSTGKESPSMNSHPSKLTIVIPAKNESKLLPSLLASLCGQDYPFMRLTKVFVADAGSSDGTSELALAFSGRLDMEVIPGGLPSIGRNAGARKASTPYVLFIDADMELKDPTLVRRAVELIERRKLHCVTTNIWCSQGS